MEPGQEQQRGNGENALLGSIIIIIILVLGGFFLLRNSIKERQIPMPLPEPENTLNLETNPVAQ